MCTKAKIPLRLSLLNNFIIVTTIHIFNIISVFCFFIHFLLHFLYICMYVLCFLFFVFLFFRYNFITLLFWFYYSQPSVQWIVEKRFLMWYMKIKFSIRWLVFSSPLSTTKHSFVHMSACLCSMQITWQG